MNQKETKRLKREIVETSALNVGYYQGVKKALVDVNPEILQMVVSEVGEALTIEAQKWNSNFDNIFVSEAVRLISYSEFKQVAKYFFGYKKTEDEILAEPITISRETYQVLQDSASRQFKHNDIKEQVEEITMDKIPNGRAAIAYNPASDELAIFSNDGVAMYDLDENLISDYKSDKSEELLVAETLIHKGNVELIDALNNSAKTSLQKNVVSEDEVINWTAQYLNGFDPSVVSWINSRLGVDDMELVVHQVSGIDPGEKIRLTYFIPDHEYYDRNFAINYLEQQVGSYYRGSLCELLIFNKDNQVNTSYKVDGNMFLNNPVDQVKKITGQSDFINIDQAVKMQSNDEVEERSRNKKMY